MALIQDQPEDLPSSNELDNVEDPDAQPEGERAEIYLSGAHVATLDNAPDGLGRVTLMVELEVVEESIRFTEGGETEIPIRRCKRVGDMWRPGTPKPPTKEEIAEQVAAGKAKAAAEAAAREEAERAEAEKNEPPMFDETGEPAIGDEDQADGDADDVSPAEKLDGSGPALAVVGPAFSDAKGGN